jgi:hypothetical protein
VIAIKFRMKQANMLICQALRLFTGLMKERAEVKGELAKRPQRRNGEIMKRAELLLSSMVEPGQGNPFARHSSGMTAIRAFETFEHVSKQTFGIADDAKSSHSLTQRTLPHKARLSGSPM